MGIFDSFKSNAEDLSTEAPAEEAVAVAEEAPVELPPAEEVAPEAAVPEEEPKVEAPVDTTEVLPLAFHSMEEWASNTVLSFLDLMDIPNVGDRRNALHSLEHGKSESKLNEMFDLADALLALISSFFKKNPSADGEPEAKVNEYIAKQAAMKKWIGM